MAIEPDQITEEKKLAIKETTNEKIFSDIDDSFRRFKKISNKIFEKVITFSSVCKRMVEIKSAPTTKKTISKYILSLEKESMNLDFEKILIKIRNDFNERLINLLQQLQTTINRIVSEKHAQLKEHTSRLKRQRLKRFIGGTTIGLVLSALAFILYYQSGFRVDQNLFMTITYAIIAVFSIVSISWGIAALTDKTKVEIEKARSRYLEQMKSEVIAMISEAKLNEYSFVHSYSSEIKDKIREKWENILQKVIHEYMENTHGPYFNKNMELYGKFETLKQLNLKSAKDLLDSCSKYYHDSKKSLKIIQSTADEIKEEVILPSFRLFDQTHSKLTKLSSALKQIEIE